MSIGVKKKDGRQMNMFDVDRNLRAKFFIFLKQIYYVMPKRFKDQIPFTAKTGDERPSFYHYIQMARRKMGEEDISFSDGKINNEEFKVAVCKIIPFVYTNIIGFYYDLDNLIGIIEQVEKDQAHFLKAVNYTDNHYKK